MINKRTIIISIVIFILIISASIVYLLIPKSYIKFATAPQQVSITIDNNKKSVTNGDTIFVTPGNHNITIYRDGFSSYTKKVTTLNGQTIEFLVSLKPLTDAAQQLLNDTKSQAVTQRFYGNVYSQQTNDITKNYPILSILPIQNRLYMVSACPSKKYPNDATKIALCVDETQSDIEPYVLKYIQSLGYNPTDYEMIWNVVSN